MSALRVGVDLGGTKTEALAIDPAGRTLCRVAAMPCAPRYSVARSRCFPVSSGRSPTLTRWTAPASPSPR